MWILTSLGRPDRIRAMVDSYRWGAESQVLLVLYDKDPTIDQYLSREWPAGWRIEKVSVKGNGPTYNEILRRYPSEPCYGFLADDTLLDTEWMLVALEHAAERWNVAYANDGHWGDALPTMPCLGGDLVRAVGYLSPPNIVHWGIDNAWGEIGRRLGVLAYLPEAKYTHLNPVWGTADDDRTYRLARQRSFGHQDLLRSWMLGGDLDAAVSRVLDAKLKVAA